jgi:hypothetical protein
VLPPAPPTLTVEAFIAASFYINDLNDEKLTSDIHDNDITSLVMTDMTQRTKYQFLNFWRKK